MMATRAIVRTCLLGLICLAPVKGRAEARRDTAASANFLVRSCSHGPAAADVLRRCEQLRAKLQRQWTRAAAGTCWEPRCEVRLYGSEADYLAAAGRGAAQSAGTSVVQYRAGKICRRAIYLLVEQGRHDSALAHELMHMVLADQFHGRPAPRWVDEGLALLEDSPAKQRLHRKDLHFAALEGRTLRIVELLTMEQLASPQQAPAFYGMSLSLVEFLLQRDEPEKLLPFVELATQQGYDRALRGCYGIDGVAGLEREWQHFRERDSQAFGRPLVQLTRHRVASE